MVRFLLLTVFCTRHASHISTCGASAPACAKIDPAPQGCVQHMALLQAVCPVM